ncbi:MAG: hypothetical protein ACTHU0_32055, partial [Kofleriaceae bacterium]
SVSFARSLALVLGVATSGAATSVEAAPKSRPRPWPAAGLCIPASDPAAACTRLTARDAAALQRAILARLDARTLRAHPQWRDARALAARPITEGRIGQYELQIGKDEAVELHGNADGVIYKITVARTRKGWTVIDIKSWSDVQFEANS